MSFTFSWYRFNELNETKIKYNVKTDKNSASVHRTHSTFYEILVAARLGMSFIVELARILRELASKKFLCWVLLAPPTKNSAGEFGGFVFIWTDWALISTF